MSKKQAGKAQVAIAPGCRVTLRKDLLTQITRTAWYDYSRLPGRTVEVKEVVGESPAGTLFKVLGTGDKLVQLSTMAISAIL